VWPAYLLPANFFPFPAAAQAAFAKLSSTQKRAIDYESISLRARTYYENLRGNDAILACGYGARACGNLAGVMRLDIYEMFLSRRVCNPRVTPAATRTMTIRRGNVSAEFPTQTALCRHTVRRVTARFKSSGIRESGGMEGPSRDRRFSLAIPSA